MKRRQRKALSCESCRQSKLRCDRRQPCSTCLRRGHEANCLYAHPNTATLSSSAARSRRPAAQTAQTASRPRPPPQPQPQRVNTPQADSPRNESPQPIHHRWDTILRRPPNEKSLPLAPTGVSFSLSFGPTTPITELLALLPPDVVREHLVCRYFTHLSPLFHILHGPTFQKQYLTFSQDSERVDLSWLALLFAICSVTLKTTDGDDTALEELWQSVSPPRDLRALSQTYRTAAMACLSQDQFLIRHNLSTLEAILILIHTISDSEGAEYGWVLLGNALNIGIALRCHADSRELTCIDRERRRRCWAGIQILHTYQALLFRDIDLSLICNVKAEMPADANDSDIREDVILMPRSQIPPPHLTQMSFMRHRIRVFHLATRICSHISGPDRLDKDMLSSLDDAISKEEQLWNSVYLINGARSILDTTSYAHLCILQTYAHQLYLLIHRPFHNFRFSQFEAQSRDRCVASSLALMDIHRQFCELPRLKCFRWLVNGTISCNALHGAVALTSCLTDMPNTTDFDTHLGALDAAVRRLCILRKNSPACANVYPLLRQLQ